MKTPRSLPVLVLAPVLASLFLGSCGDESRFGSYMGGASSGPGLILIDTDTAAGVPIGLDVDDDLAVLFALASPEVAVLGLTVIYGNAPVMQTYPDAVHLMELAGLEEMPVVRGAGWLARDVHRETDASRFLIETILSQNERVTMVCIGPLTNLAAALTQEPQIEERIDRIVMMGGYLKQGMIDLNFSSHPEATEVVLESSIPKVVVPTETCIQSTFTQAELDRVNEHPEAVIHAYRDRLALFVQMWSFLGDIVFAGFPERASGGFFPWDVVAVAYMIRPELFSEERFFTARMNGASFESSPCDGPGDNRNRVSVPMKLQAGAFMHLMTDRVLSIPCAQQPPDSEHRVD